MRHDVCCAENALAELADDFEDAAHELLMKAGGKVPYNPEFASSLAEAFSRELKGRDRVLYESPRVILDVTIQV